MQFRITPAKLAGSMLGSEKQKEQSFIPWYVGFSCVMLLHAFNFLIF